MKQLLTGLIILTSIAAASAQLTDTFTDGTPMGWQVGPAALVPPSGPRDRALTEDAASIRAGESWQTFNFSLAVADLLPGEVRTIPSTRRDAATSRLRHDPAPTSTGPGILVTLAADNIAAINLAGPVSVTVPEPATYLSALGLCGLVVLNYVRRRFRPA